MKLRVLVSQRGVSMVELVVSIVVISVALTGVLLVMVRNISASADPLLQHQALAIAEAYLEEILTQNFADPDVDGGETRATTDDVSDYNKASVLPDTVVRDQNGNAIAGLSQYAVSVQVVAEALHTIAAANAYRVTVTVTPPNGTAVVLSGYRTNY